MIVTSQASAPWNLRHSLYAVDRALYAFFAHWACSSWAGFRLSLGASETILEISPLFFTRWHKILNLQLISDNNPISFQSIVKLLGPNFDHRLNWKNHIDYLIVNCNEWLDILKYILRFIIRSRDVVFFNGAQVPDINPIITFYDYCSCSVLPDPFLAR